MLSVGSLPPCHRSGGAQEGASHLLVANNSPYQSLKDLMAAAKAKPGMLTYGSLGVGSGAHVRSELMNNLAGTTMVHIPYKGNQVPEILEVWL